ncbi:MAG: response regulator [Pseudobdellovibrionaceae bacterium]|nr:response regulator [Bdellovibrionales bacterium]USN48890.1 MAG: response regulator [Pseudobdellovibrionaceae bacterium]
MFPQDSKILVVEDSESLLRLIGEILNAEGYGNVHLAKDGSEAIGQLTMAAKVGEPFNLVITDITMPNLGGMELLDACRESNNLKNTPFMMITSDNSKNTVVQAVIKGVIGYIVKPIEREDFMNKMREAYERLMGSVG